MNIETLKKEYPKLYAKLPEDIDALRYLMVIDENYNDDDSDEFDAIDPEDYNYLVYITELLQSMLGEQVMVEFVKALSEHKNIDEFYLSDVDLYGIQTKLDEDGIAHMICSSIEVLL